MKKNSFLLLLPTLFLLNVAMAIGSSNAGVNPVQPIDQALTFTENKGQIADLKGNLRPDILFCSLQKGMNIYFKNNSIIYLFQKRVGDKILPKGHNLIEFSKAGQLHTYRIEMNLLGSNPNAQIEAEGEQAGVTNFYLPHCPQGILGVKSYNKITIKEVYPGIDWVVYVKDQKSIEYDFVVKPGANVADIKIKYDGAIDLKIRDDGNLKIKSPIGEINESAPISFDNENRIVKSGFKLEKNTLSFTHEAYDKTKVLTIDPSIVWQLDYGDSGTDATSCKVDLSGNVYLAGNTASSTGIASGGFDNTFNGGYDAFVAKFNSAGTRIWGTYYGGTGDELVKGITVDPSNNVLICGSTTSGTGIASGGWDNLYDGNNDGFIVKFNTSGARIWATYYGGTNGEDISDITTNASGEIYFAGFTSSNASIASPGSHQPALSEVIDGFLVKFNSSGSRLWGTYYGGINVDACYSVALDLNGNVFIGGITNSGGGIASPGSWDASFNGEYDAFLAKFNASGTRAWGTYYGGTASDWINDITLDGNNNLVGIGVTSSTTNIAAGGFDNSLGGQNDAFVIKFTNNGTRIWGTYFGGTGIDEGYSITCDLNNSIYALGYAVSTGLSFQGFQNTNIDGDGFLVKFNSNGSRIWSSYYGVNNAIEQPVDISCLSTDILYFCGYVAVSIGLDEEEEDNSRVALGKGFFVKIDVCNIAPTNLNATICSGQTYNFNGQQLTVGGNYNATYVSLTGCDSLVNLTLTVITVQVATSSTPARCDHPTGSATATGSGGGPPYSYQWSNGGLTSTINTLLAGTYTVTVTDINNCKKITSVVVQNIIGISSINVSFTPTTCGLNNGTANALGIGGTPPLQYLWSNFSHAPTLTDLPAGPYSVTVTDANDCTYDTSIVIGFSLALTSDFDTISPLCGQSNGALYIGVQNGELPYIFELIGPINIVSNSINDDNYTFSNIPAGNYFYKVTDSNGCVFENIVTLITDSGLTGTATSAPAICNSSGTITASVQGGSPPYIYSIDGPVDDSTSPIFDLMHIFTGVTEGNYQVSIIDVNQCIFLANINVESESNIASSNTPKAAHCNKADGSIDISVTGHAPFIYSINGPVQMISPTVSSTTYTFNNLLPGNYSYTVTDASGCTITQDFIIQNLPGVSLASNFVQSDCGQLNGSITLTANQGNSPYIFDLSGQSTQTSGSVNTPIYTFMGLGAGIYSGTVTDQLGCTSFVEINIIDKNGVNGIVSATASNCNTPDGVFNVTAMGGLAPFVYELSGTSVATSGSIVESNYSFIGLIAGNYEVKITDSRGCIYVEQDTILSLNTLLITATTSSSECGSPTGAISIASTGGSLPIVYEIKGATSMTSGSINSTSFNFEKLLAGPYTVTVTDSKGCVAELEVNVDNLSGFKSESEVTSTSCGDLNGVITLTAIDGLAPFTYSISGPLNASQNGIQNNTFTFGNLPAGEYSYKITDSNNCNLMGIADVENSSGISFDVNLSGFNCGGGNGTITINNVSGNGPFSYKLNDVPTTMDSVFSGLISNTNYFLEVFDTKGCRSDSTILTNSDISFNAVTDTVYFDYYSNPVKFDVLQNDELNGLNNFEVKPVDKQVLNKNLEPIGTIINAQGSQGEFEFYYHGNYNSNTKKYELYYPMDKELIYYLLCTDDCPGACDTGTIVLLSKYECIDNNKDFVNTFTPNGDGQNDVLVLPQFPECSVQASEIKVFNRWGKAVFNAKNYANNWDGKNDNGVDLPEGTYYYVLQLKTQNGSTHVIKNFIELLR